MKDVTEGLFALRGDLNKQQGIVLGVVGAALSIFIWWTIVKLGLVPKQVLPSPLTVLTSIPELHFRDGLVQNVSYTLRLNLEGLLFAVLFSIPCGYLIGLVPLLRGMTAPMLNGLRFAPLPITMGLFMVFGIGDVMKITFLAFAIFVYLVPTVIQRIDETPQVYINTALTLGATNRQIVRYVFIPEVLSRVWDDIVILVGISWTYISIVEVINKSDGGIGALMWTASRQSNVSKVYALLIVLMLVAFVQTKIFKIIGDFIFPFKKIGR